MKTFFLTAFLSSVLLVTGCVTTNSGKAKPKPYLLDKCLVINKPLEGRTYTRIHGDQEYKFCCMPCVRTFEASPEPWVQKYREETGAGTVEMVETISTAPAGQAGMSAQ